MFKVVSETLVWWPVVFPGVTEDGAIVENKIEMRFVILDEDAIDAFGRDAQAIQSEEPESASAAPSTPSEKMQRVLAPIVRGWRQVAAENGEPMPFNEDNFRALLRVPNVYPAILTAYRACRAGRAEIRAEIESRRARLGKRAWRRYPKIG